MDFINLNKTVFVIPEIRDPEFGLAGVINLYELQHELDLDRHIKGLHALTDNKILASAWLAHELLGVYGLARFNPDGSVDTSFADEGLAQGNFANGYDSCGGALAVQADGSITMLGWSRKMDVDSPKRLVIARFDQNGFVDCDFGQHGCILMDSNDLGDYVADSACLRSAADGKTVISATYQNKDRLIGVLWRIDAHGNLDKSFNKTGQLIIENPNATGLSANTLLVQSDNGILLAGKIQRSATEIQGYVARYLSNGELDSRFGGPEIPGFSIVSISNGTVIFHEMVGTGEGQFVGIGQASAGQRNWGLLIGFSSSGGANPEFNDGRPVLTSFNAKHGNEWVCAHQQADGKIITAGGSKSLYTARYLANGAIDRSFGVNGYVQEDTTLVTTPAALQTQTNGRILLAGNTLGIGGALGHIYAYVG